MSATYDIRLTRIPGYGKPVFYVKIMDSGSGFAPRQNNNHFSSSADPVKPISVQNLTLDLDMRITRWPLCASYKFSLKGDGTQSCFVAISVTCADNTFCAYKLKINENGIDSGVV